MKAIIDLLIRFFVCYGKTGAKRPSFHGFYEQKVPDCLKRR